MDSQCEFNRQLQDNLYTARDQATTRLDSTSCPEMAVTHGTVSHLSL